MNYEGKKKIWSEFQKEIPDDRYFYARSCIRQNFNPGAEQAFLDIVRNRFGKDFYEDPLHTTCGGIAYHSDTTPEETSMTIIARQFSLMNQAGYKNFVVSCVTSFGLHSEILQTWEEHPEIEQKIHELLWKACRREFTKPEFLMHSSDMMYHYRFLISEQAKYPLINVHTGEPLKVVEHIGCHYSKIFPSKSVGGAEYPRVLAGLIEALGGSVIDYPERRHCCGFGFRQYLVKANRGYSLTNTYKKFESMEPFHPDFIVTNCPGCNYFLDRWQYVIAETSGKTYGDTPGYGIPVLSSEEVAALVMGYDPWDLGLQMHQVAVEPLLDKMGVKYDRSRKYKGLGGKDLGVPVSPANIRIF